MILYHFTHPSRVAAILRDGLRLNAPAREGLDGHDIREGWMTGEVPVVWLVKQPKLNATIGMQRVHGLLSPLNLPYSCVCLRVDIPARDRKRLRHWMTWVRDNDVPGVSCPNYAREALWQNWIYLGDIPPEQIRIHHIRVPSRRVWVHKKWRATIRRDLKAAGFAIPARLRLKPAARAYE
jgi:hypothetical protein